MTGTIHLQQFLDSPDSYTSLSLTGQNIDDAGGRAIGQCLARNMKVLWFNNKISPELTNQINELMCEVGCTTLHPLQQNSTSPVEKRIIQIQNQIKKTINEIKTRLSELEETAANHPEIKVLLNLIAEGNERITES